MVSYCLNSWSHVPLLGTWSKTDIRTGSMRCRGEARLPESYFWIPMPMTQLPLALEGPLSVCVWRRLPFWSSFLRESVTSPITTQQTPLLRAPCHRFTCPHSTGPCGALHSVTPNAFLSLQWLKTEQKYSVLQELPFSVLRIFFPF